MWFSIFLFINILNFILVFNNLHTKTEYYVKWILCFYVYVYMYVQKNIFDKQYIYIFIQYIYIYIYMYILFQSVYLGIAGG